MNKFTAVYQPDGSVEIVIAHQDPGPRYPNWLNTCGHDQGGMIGRYIGALHPPTAMPAEVVPFTSLAKRP